MTWGIPNLITLFRLAASFFLLLWFYLAPGPHKILIFLFLAVFNNILDTVDGNLARWLGKVTESGKFFDAAGDRLFKTALMCLLSAMGIFPWFLTAFHLGFKNQFFEVPAFYVEGRVGDRSRVKRELPLYHVLTYNKPWLAFGIMINYGVWSLLIYNAFNRTILTPGQMTALYLLFFMHSLVRALPFISIYTYIDKGLPATGSPVIPASKGQTDLSRTLTTITHKR